MQGRSSATTEIGTLKCGSPRRTIGAAWQGTCRGSFCRAEDPPSLPGKLKLDIVHSGFTYITKTPFASRLPLTSRQLCKRKRNTSQTVFLVFVPFSNFYRALAVLNGSARNMAAISLSFTKSQNATTEEIQKPCLPMAVVIIGPSGLIWHGASCGSIKPLTIAGSWLAHLWQLIVHSLGNAGTKRCHCQFS